MKVKAFVQAIAIAAALAAPAVSFAQSNGPVTRAQVRQQLVQLEQAGYRPGDGDQTTYPVPIQQAEARVARESAVSNGYGGVAAGSSASGSRAVPAPEAAIPGLKPVYFGQ
ncbi:DUF4148 domain-containing protein [Paraburkholderia pallida]|uniref:DUF4148 domain-containing protein n=1 Tax=Paraburkholderia pallida TaxID=2547399 RepID=A0A4P7D4T2_9BURK|nr:DUF4148 domain-containing protein [Paraburkholderia pallida]QBR01612.1 DUF4148 domain-containing protein [Paraburkholderia pallida]